MDIASLVLGIIGVIFSFIPFCNIISIIICIVGLVLGIVSLVLKAKAGNPKGMAIAGVVLNAIGLIFWILPFFALASI